MGGKNSEVWGCLIQLVVLVSVIGLSITIILTTLINN